MSLEELWCTTGTGWLMKADQFLVMVRCRRKAILGSLKDTGKRGFMREQHHNIIFSCCVVIFSLGVMPVPLFLSYTPVDLYL
jgi:hypothetical protein